MTRRPSLTPEWSLFRRADETVAVPRAPLLIRLRRVVGDGFFEQPALAPLRRFMEAVFVAGPVCILVALYLPTGGGLLVWLGILCLAVASLWWFAPHLLCRIYLTRRGYEIAGAVEAADHEGALAKGTA